MFRRLNWKRLPRVMVKCLALDPRDQEVILEDLDKLAKQYAEAGASWAEAVCEIADGEPNKLAQAFAAILDLSEEDRADFSARFDRLLDMQGDLFGTEGQLDPRGDRRD